MDKLLNLIFIPECTFCGELGTFFCSNCLGECKKINRTITVNKLNTVFLFGYEYQGKVRECIRTAKYRGKHFAALKILSDDVCENAKSKMVDYDFIVPIPVTKYKLKKRGFNQAQVIAQTFSKCLKKPLCLGVLNRAKETISQYTQSKIERFKNLKGAFVAKRIRDLCGANVVLVDDICTTGATFLEAAKTLRNAGANKVLCVAIARKS